jgi:hypothetical protein
MVPVLGLMPSWLICDGMQGIAILQEERKEKKRKEKKALTRGNAHIITFCSTPS